MLAHLHHYALVAAALTAAFILELSGAFRVGAAGVFLPLIIILLAGFFGVRWFAGFLAFLLLALSFLVAPFWVLEVGGVALVSLALLFTVPFLTGNRFMDFSILLTVGALVVTVGGGLVRGGVFSFTATTLTLGMNLVVGALAFSILSKYFPSLRSLDQ